MTVKEMIGKVMAALDEAENKPLWNNAADYETKIYAVIDSVQREIATAWAPIERSVVLNIKNGQAQLPADVYSITYMSNEDAWAYGRTVFGDDGSLVVRYDAYPKTIDSTMGEEALEISEEAQEAMVFGVCAGLCINDEPELYPVYLERFYGMMNTIHSRRQERPTGRVTGGVSF